MSIIKKGGQVDRYLPELILPAFIDFAYIEPAVETPFGLVDQLVIGYKTAYNKNSRNVRETYIIPYTDNNKAGKFLMSLLGEIPDKLEVSELIYLDCYIRIEHRPLKNGGTWAGVAEVYPWPQEETESDSNNSKDVQVKNSASVDNYDIEHYEDIDERDLDIRSTQERLEEVDYEEESSRSCRHDEPPRSCWGDEILESSCRYDDESPRSFWDDEIQESVCRYDDEPPRSFWDDEIPESICRYDDEPPRSCSDDEIPESICRYDDEPPRSCWDDEMEVAIKGI